MPSILNCSLLFQQRVNETQLVHLTPFSRFSSLETTLHHLVIRALPLAAVKPNTPTDDTQSQATPAKPASDTGAFTMNHSELANQGGNRGNWGKTFTFPSEKKVTFNESLFYHRRTKAMDMSHMTGMVAEGAAESMSRKSDPKLDTRRQERNQNQNRKMFESNYFKKLAQKQSNIGIEQNLYRHNVAAPTKSHRSVAPSATVIDSPISIDDRSPSVSRSSSSSFNFSNYSVDSFDSTTSIESLSPSKSITTTESSINPQPIEMEYQADIPLDKTGSKPILLSYRSQSNQSVLLSMVLCDEPNRNRTRNRTKVMLYETNDDDWESLRRKRNGFEIYHPEYPEAVVIDSDCGELYLLDQGMMYNLERKEWDFKPILPVVSQWETSGSSTLYIGGNVGEFHGVYHDKTDYGQRHLILESSDEKRRGNAVPVSTHGHIDAELRFSGLQMIHCGWLQQLTVFGGRVAKRNEEEKMSYPGSFEIERWDENKFSYSCNIGRHDRESTKLSNENFNWNRSANKVGNLYHTEMRSVVVFDHIAIIFKYFGKDQYIEMRCWDLISNKRQKSPYVLDFECVRFEDFCVVQMGGGDIRVFNRGTREHVSVNAMHIMSASFRAKTEVRYMSLVRGWCGRSESKELGEHNMKLIANYLFVLAASFRCGCGVCTQ